MTLETFLFKRNLETYKEKFNKIDLHLVKILHETVESISTFLSNAQIQETDNNYNVYYMIPSINNEVCQGHRYFYCKPCNRHIKASANSFMEHFFCDNHTANLLKYEKTLEESDGVSDQRGSMISENERRVVPRVDQRTRRGGARQDSQRISNIPFNTAKKYRIFLNQVNFDQYISELEIEGDMIKQSNVHGRICQILQSQLSVQFPKVATYAFGSVVNGLARNGGDLDIYIDLGNCYVQKPPKRLMGNVIFRTKNILISQTNDWGGFCPITKARTPILKVVCKSMGIQCDFSFSNGLSHRNTLLIGYFLDLQPICRKVVLFVKSWMSDQDLGMNSYIITMLAIFYFQQKNLLPSVETLQSNCPRVFIDGWLASFDPLPLEKLGIERDNSSILEHLIGFFQFYGHQFNFKKFVISILAGRPIDKRIFDHGLEEDLPEVFERFKLYMRDISLDEADPVEDLFANEKPLVVQDPFELCHNVAKGIREKGLKKIVESMKQTHEILSKRATL